MDSRELEQYLHQQIPLSAAMQVTVRSVAANAIVLAAPLEPNINHKRTAFGGSVSTLGILAAWSLVHLRLRDAGLTCEVVIQSNQMDYDRPITGAFTARSALVDDAAWPTFLKTLARRKLARIEAQSELIHGDVVAGRLRGRFVAFLQDRP